MSASLAMLHFSARARIANSQQANRVVGTGRFELPTCRLGGDRSIHLSYVPAFYNDSTSAFSPSVRYPSGSARLRSGSWLLTILGQRTTSVALLRSRFVFSALIH